MGDNPAKFLVGITFIKKGHELHDRILSFMANTPLASLQFTNYGENREPIKINNEEIKNIALFTKMYIKFPKHVNMWNNKHKDTVIEIFKNSIMLNASGIIIKIPRLSIDNIVNKLKIFMVYLIQKGVYTPIILEISDNKPHPTMSWESPEKIIKLINKLNENKLTSRHIGFCINTANMYKVGEKIKTYSDVLTWLKKIPEGWIKLIHLNGINIEDEGYAAPLSHVDKIWGGYNQFPNESGCMGFINFARNKSISIITECNDLEFIKPFIIKFGRIQRHAA